MTTEHKALSREQHIDHLKKRYEECLLHGDKNMAKMFKQKFTNMEKAKGE